MVILSLEPYLLLSPECPPAGRLIMAYLLPGTSLFFLPAFAPLLAGPFFSLLPVTWLPAAAGQPQGCCMSG